MGFRKICAPATILISLSIGLMCLCEVFLPSPQKAVGWASEIFTNITDQSGITWTHFSGESEDRFLVEAVSGGVAFLDFNNDGLLDLYLVNGGETPKGKCKSSVSNALYRNRGNGKFQDVAQEAGVDRIDAFGMGVAVADYDN